jgi:hypothetical protein
MYRQLTACFAFLFIVVFVAYGDDKPKAEHADFANQSKPGPEHERLLALAGKWTLSIDGVKETGTAVYKPILGGRFVTEEVKLPFGEMTFEWHGIYGYDKQKKKYTAVWVDNMDTTTEIAEGECDAAGKVITLKGEHPDPRTGKSAKFTWRITRDGDKLTIEMFEGGSDKASLTVRGTRVKAS